MMRGQTVTENRSSRGSSGLSDSEASTHKLGKSHTMHEKAGKKRKKHYKPGDFEQIKLIGEGSYGQVYLVKRISDGKKMAMKELDKQFLKKCKKEVSHLS